jgi:hypothetical protein
MSPPQKHLGRGRDPDRAEVAVHGDVDPHGVGRIAAGAVPEEEPLLYSSTAIDVPLLGAVLSAIACPCAR